MNRRTFSIRPHTRADDPADDDTFAAVLSSDAPIDRGGYTEKLSHTPGAVNLARAPLPLLEAHDNSKVNIGHVENLRVDGGKLRGDVRFGSSARAKELMTDIKSKIVRSLSVGYSIDDYEADGDGNITATRWTPMETSLVPVPADTNAGFYRSRQTMNDDTSAGDGHLSRTQRIEQRRTADAERSAATAAGNRAANIAALAQRHGMSDRTAGWLASGLSETEIREEIMESLGTDPRTIVRSGAGAGDPLFQSDFSTRGRSKEIPVEELRKYSLLKAIRSQLRDDPHSKRAAGFELEISSFMADKVDREVKGILVPDEVVWGVRSGARYTRAMNTGTGSQGGDLVATDLLAGEFIDVLSNQPQVYALGARQLTGLVGNVAIPRKTARGSVTWIGEGGDFGDTKPALDLPTMSPHDLAARVDITRRLLLQSTPAADDLVRSDLQQAIAIGIDLAAITGTGSSNQPTGILNVSGIGSVSLGTNGAAPTWAAITQVIQALAVANGLRGNLGWLTNGNVMGTLMRVPVVTGFPRFIWEAGAPGARPDEGTIGGYRALVSNNVPNTLTKGSGSNLSALIFGNWSDLIIGQWSGIDMLVDPYSGSATGTLRITAISTIDILARHAPSFVAIEDAVTT